MTAGTAIGLLLAITYAETEVVSPWVLEVADSSVWTREEL